MRDRVKVPAREIIASSLAVGTCPSDHLVGSSQSPLTADFQLLLRSNRRRSSRSQRHNPSAGANPRVFSTPWHCCSRVVAWSCFGRHASTGAGAKQTNSKVCINVNFSSGGPHDFGSFAITASISDATESPHGPKVCTFVERSECAASRRCRLIIKGASLDQQAVELSKRPVLPHDFCTHLLCRGLERRCSCGRFLNVLLALVGELDRCDDVAMLAPP